MVIRSLALSSAHQHRRKYCTPYSYIYIRRRYLLEIAACTSDYAPASRTAACVSCLILLHVISCPSSNQGRDTYAQFHGWRRQLCPPCPGRCWTSRSLTCASRLPCIFWAAEAVPNSQVPSHALHHPSPPSKIPSRL